MANPQDKIFDIASAVEWRESLRKVGRKLAVTNGCFDLLHRGHAEYLLSAKGSAGALAVLLNSDASVKELKGEGRPICSEGDRAYLLSCLYFVDAVVVFKGMRCDKELLAIKPDIYVKGGDYKLDSLDPDERDALLKSGAEIRFAGLLPGLSTSSLLEKMRR